MEQDIAEFFKIPEKPRIYVAAPWVEKAEALEVQTQLEEAGFEVTSNWIKYHPEVEKVICEACQGVGRLGLTSCETCQGHGAGNHEAYAAMLKEQAIKDLEDIDRSHVVVLLNLGRSDGKAFELGYAYATMKGLIVVGGTEGNLFYHLPSVRHVGSVEAAIAEIKQTHAEAKAMLEDLQKEWEGLEAQRVQQQVRLGKVTLN